MLGVLEELNLLVDLMVEVKEVLHLFLQELQLLHLPAAVEEKQILVLHKKLEDQEEEQELKLHL